MAKYKKGQSGNPNGRPKRDWTWASILEEVGEEIEPKSGRKFKELVSKKLWIKAANGDIMAVKEILNRMDGMPHQSTDITSGGKPLPILGGASNVSTDNSNKEDSGTDKKD